MLNKMLALDDGLANDVWALEDRGAHDMTDLHRLDSVRYHRCADVTSHLMLMQEGTALPAHLALGAVINRSRNKPRSDIAMFHVVV